MSKYMGFHVHTSASFVLPVSCTRDWSRRSWQLHSMSWAPILITPSDTEIRNSPNTRVRRTGQEYIERMVIELSCWRFRILATSRITSLSSNPVSSGIRQNPCKLRLVVKSEHNPSNFVTEYAIDQPKLPLGLDFNKSTR